MVVSTPDSRLEPTGTRRVALTPLRTYRNHLSNVYIKISAKSETV